MTVGIGGEINEEKGYINGYCTCCRGITVHSFHDPEQKVRCIICKGYCGKSGKCGKRTGICPAEAENEKRNKTGEASWAEYKKKLLPNLTNPYYVMLLQGIEAHAKEKGFGLFVCNTQRDLKMEERYLKMMWQLRPLGIIYTCNPSHCFMELVGEIAEQIPVAIVNNQNEKMNVDAVELDNSKLGRVMAKHLLELGHRKVAYIAPPLTARQKQRSKRVEGFLKEYEKVGLRDQVIIKAAKEEIDLDVAHIDSEYKIGYELTKELLKETTDVTAIVGLNDMIAFGIMDALHEAKIKVPTDVSVMGCDNTLFARMHNMNLTTIEHFVTFKGRDACDIIMKKIATHHSTNTGAVPISTYHVEYEPQLIVRGTTTYAKNARKKKN